MRADDRAQARFGADRARDRAAELAELAMLALDQIPVAARGEVVRDQREQRGGHQHGSRTRAGGASHQVPHHFGRRGKREKEERKHQPGSEAEVRHDHRQHAQDEELRRLAAPHEQDQRGSQQQQRDRRARDPDGPFGFGFRERLFLQPISQHGRDLTGAQRNPLQDRAPGQPRGIRISGSTCQFATL